MIQKRYLSLVGMVLLLLAGCGQAAVLGANTATPVSSRFFEHASLVRDAMQGTPHIKTDRRVNIGITSHHLPTAVTFIAALYKELASTDGPRETFIILGPDHFERCSTDVSTTLVPYRTPFGDIAINETIAHAIIENGGVTVDDRCFSGEHAIGVQSIFISYLYPGAQIVPVTFSSMTDTAQIEKLVQALVPYKDEVTVIVSVDFSHYHPVDQARSLDTKAASMIEKLSGGSITLEYVDSPASVKAALSLAEAWGVTDVRILGHANSYDFTDRAENTTGYVNVLFEEGE